MNSKEKYFSFIVNISLNFRSFVKSHHAFNNRKNNLFQLNCKLNTQENTFWKECVLKVIINNKISNQHLNNLFLPFILNLNRDLSKLIIRIIWQSNLIAWLMFSSVVAYKLLEYQIMCICMKPQLKVRIRALSVSFLMYS